MKFGIIGAMEEELRLLKAELESIETHNIYGIEMLTGQLGQHELILVKSGIGKVNASLSTSLLIERFQPDYVINTGSAGGLSPQLKIGDLVIADSLAYHDVDVTAFGYQYGQMAGMEASFHPDQNLIQVASQEYRKLGREAHQGLIVSGDQFVNLSSRIDWIRQQFPLALACEMESTAIGHTCQSMGTPYLILRAISDKANEEAAVDFDSFILQAGAVAAEHVKMIVLSL